MGFLENALDIVSLLETPPYSLQEDLSCQPTMPRLSDADLRDIVLWLAQHNSFFKQALFEGRSVDILQDVRHFEIAVKKALEVLTDIYWRFPLIQRRGGYPLLWYKSRILYKEVLNASKFLFFAIRHELRRHFVHQIIYCATYLVALRAIDGLWASNMLATNFTWDQLYQQFWLMLKYYDHTIYERLESPHMAVTRLPDIIRAGVGHISPANQRLRNVMMTALSLHKDAPREFLDGMLQTNLHGARQQIWLRPDYPTPPDRLQHILFCNFSRYSSDRRAWIWSRALLHPNLPESLLTMLMFGDDTQRYLYQLIKERRNRYAKQRAV